MVDKRVVGRPFAKGNKLAVGSGGPSRPNFLTQSLISQLNEIDKNTSQEKKHMLTAKLIQLAFGGVFKVHVKDRKTGRVRLQEVPFPPDLNAIREIFNRTEGKPIQPVEANIGGGITIRIAPEDADV